MDTSKEGKEWRIVALSGGQGDFAENASSVAESSQADSQSEESSGGRNWSSNEAPGRGSQKQS